MMMMTWGLMSSDVGLTDQEQLTDDDDDDDDDDNDDVGLNVLRCGADRLGTTY